MEKVARCVPKHHDELSYLCAYFRDAGPWYFADRIKAFSRNFKESSCSISPNSARPSIV